MRTVCRGGVWESSSSVGEKVGRYSCGTSTMIPNLQVRTVKYRCNLLIIEQPLSYTIHVASQSLLLSIYCNNTSNSNGFG